MFMIWLQTYKYLVVFPLVVIEGPIITIVCGFLSSIGQLNFWLAYLVIVLGDITGDSLYYLLGRLGINHIPPKILRFFGITPERLALVEKYFHQHPKKTFALGKVSHGVGAVPLFAAGLVKFPFGKFLSFNLIFTAVKSLLLLVVGYYFGQAYAHFKTYLDIGAIIGVVGFIVLYFVFLKLTKPKFYEE